MTRSARFSLFLTVILFLVTVAPLILYGIGRLLNNLWYCDIRDESGEVYGDCPESQSDIVYMLLMMPWFMLFTLPFVGIPAVIALAVTVILVLLGSRKGRKA